MSGLSRRAPFLATVFACGLTACASNGPIPPLPPGAMATVQGPVGTPPATTLSSLTGDLVPQISTVTIPAGTLDPASPTAQVTRVVFSERAFFAFDQDQPLPGAARAFDAIAGEMKAGHIGQTVTVLGHTDSIGSAAYNVDLSRRRAEAALRALAARGIPTAALSAVAIGARQPIASNDTDAGRALNRRVEFLISPSQADNLAAIRQTHVMAGNLATDIRDVTSAPIYGLNQNGLLPAGDVALAPPDPLPATAPLEAAPVRRARVQRVRPVKLLAPQPVQSRPLGSNQTSY
ncbi:hypothetical protein AA101099_2160 [Neoasaia chiangmaiensis NBRC 101099]|nr:OmpA family protein [Neoasaia chiangmaiensis]GBR40537.1 hypothetical protein AA101099_2160 [Neoasaia chiangmaiensis NBRC 101099]GEN13852.1 hypothetical protein NCH01_02830 [Neoasaia chiangmaiensis]